MQKNRRILVIDDHRAIHDDVRKLLTSAPPSEASQFEEALFGDIELQIESFEIESAYQGQEGALMVGRARAAGRPYALAIVDMRMPPGWDGLQTIEKLWEVDPDIQVVICSAYSDASWQDIQRRFGSSDKLLILKKPFDAIEVCQLACALTEKWHLARQAHLRVEELNRMVEDQTRDLRLLNAELQRSSETELVKKGDELSRNLALARGIQEAVIDGILVVDESGKVVSSNGRLIEMWRIPPGVAASGDGEALLRFAIDQLAEPEGFLARIRDLYRHPDEVLSGDIRLKDGRIFERWTGPVQATSGATFGRLWCFRDVTHVRTIEAERALATERMASQQRQLVEALDGAREASRAKSDFLANISHEIRTPMNGVIGMTDLALDTDLTTHQRECLATVKSSAESLLTLLNDILDFSKIESRKLTLETIPFSVRELVSRLVKPMAVKADQQGLELLYDIDPGVSSEVQGDPVRLQQVLNNLIGNALKFTERGHVLLEIREDARLEGETVLHFSVSDTGIGIPDEKRSMIFEAFSQADGSTTRRFGGTGLGLTISSNLVNLMRGRIWVESEARVGSTFHFTARFLLAEPAQQPEARPEPRLAGLPVLIVDDNAATRRILHTQLTRWHARPTAVGSGREALEALSAAAQVKCPFGLILLDVKMPDVNGFHLAEQVAARPELNGATIMMLSSSGHQDERVRCVELGIFTTVSKPVRTADLHDAICRVLNHNASKAVVPSAPAARRSIPLALHPLRILLAEDNVVNQRVAVGLLTKRGHQVTVANNGIEALSALEQHTFDLVLMDVQMPEMGGFDATIAIRSRELTRGAHIRIVAMTAHAMDGDHARCLAVGMDGYLAKPISPAMLFATVEHESARSYSPW